jgi:hypothetical protein
VAVETGLESEPRLLFTAPWEPVVVRRGDALGLRALADQFADAVAPDLSNRVRDGRWITILAWCLARSQQAFHASGGRSVETRSQQRERYAWLRPLELMWVARTIALAKEDWRDRSLAGQRRVRPWYEDDEQYPDRFGMSFDQFRAYRQTGMYGGYRLAFRKWPGMTVLGNGWTPASATNKLAEWLDKRLGAARPPWPLHVGDGDENSLSGHSAKLGRGKEDRWWKQHWKQYHHHGKNADTNTLPRRKDDFSPLPEAELLKPLVFGEDQKGLLRLKVAREVAKASATDHIQVCTHLGSVFDTNRTISLLPRFSRLADAGMEVMDLVAKSLQQDSKVKLVDVASHPAAESVCEEVMAAARDWCQGAEMQVRHIETAHRFANAISRTQPIECIRALLQHHEVYGGGLRWFVLRNGWVEPRTVPRVGSSRYRFRLWSLCRLAAQCGILRDMPLALRGDTEAEDEASEAGNE